MADTDEMPQSQPSRGTEQRRDEERTITKQTPESRTKLLRIHAYSNILKILQTKKKKKKIDRKF